MQSTYNVLYKLFPSSNATNVKQLLTIKICL